MKDIQDIFSSDVILFTLSNEDNYEDKTILDYCADKYDEEAKELVEYLEKNLGNES